MIYCEDNLICIIYEKAEKSKNNNERATRASKKKLQKPRKETQNTKKCYHSSKSKKVTSNPAAKVVLLLKTNEEPKAALQRMGTDVDFKAQDKEYDVPNIFTPRRATSQITIRFSTPTLCAPCHPLSPCIQHRSFPKSHVI
mgnify:CR=1 FL=1